MARVLRFERAPDQHGGIQPTEVVCRWKTFIVGSGARFVQLDTYGSRNRMYPEKLSQTLQFDERATRELIAILQAAVSGRQI